MFKLMGRFRFAFAFPVEKTNTLTYELTYESPGTFSHDRHCVMNDMIRMNDQ